MTTRALTIDLEDWHQLVHRRVTGELIRPSRAAIADTMRLLDLLDETRTRATFFVVGYLASAYPGLVREVARRGHEIGSHTYSHRLIYDMEPSAFREDMDRSRKQLQDLTGQEIIGFRAPEFSVSNLKHWCFDILAGLGFRYDSSVFPLAQVRYGIADAPRDPFDIETPSGPIREFPLATWAVGRFNVPIAGGTYYRFLPVRVLRQGLQDVSETSGTTVLYFHPYEFHRGRLYLSGLTWRQYAQPSLVKLSVLHNLFTSAIRSRVRILLRDFHFEPLGEIYKNE